MAHLKKQHFSPHQSLPEIASPKKEHKNPAASWKKGMPNLNEELDQVNEKIAELKGKEPSHFSVPEQLREKEEYLPRVSADQPRTKPIVVESPKNQQWDDALQAIEQKLEELPTAEQQEGRLIDGLPPTGRGFKKNWHAFTDLFTSYNHTLLTKKQAPQNKAVAMNIKIRDSLEISALAQEEKTTLPDDAIEDILYTVDDTVLQKLTTAVAELQEKWGEVQKNIQKVKVRRELVREVTKTDQLQYIEKELAKLPKLREETVRTIEVIPDRGHNREKEKKLEQELSKINTLLDRGIKAKLLKLFTAKRPAEETTTAKIILETTKENLVLQQKLQNIEQELQELQKPAPYYEKIIQETHHAVGTPVSHPELIAMQKELKSIDEKREEEISTAKVRQEKIKQFLGSLEENKTLQKKLQRIEQELQELQKPLLPSEKIVQETPYAAGTHFSHPELITRQKEIHNIDERLAKKKTVEVSQIPKINPSTELLAIEEELLHLKQQLRREQLRKPIPH